MRLSFQELLFLYTGICLGGVLLAAWMHNLRRTRHERAAIRGLIKCQSCAFQFRDETGAILPRCPQCGALNERKPLSRL
jgi:predicted RNA-binding Zn-ribbon protein involved in translation (DUF1610 family)